jgi:hypothetical protein
MAALVIAEHDNASIKPATLNTVTAAAEACGGEVHVLVAGTAAGAAAAGRRPDRRRGQGAARRRAGLGHGLAENVAAQVLAVAAGYSHMLFPATAAGKNVAPRVAALLDVAQISDITKVDQRRHLRAPDLRRQRDRHRAEPDAVKVITVRTTGFDAAAATGGSAAVEAIAAVADSGKTSFMGSEIAKSDRPELTAAKIIVSGGRGWAAREVQRGARRRWPTSSAPRWAPAAPRSTPATRPTTGRSARPARSSRPAVCGLRHQRRHPAPGRHEGQQGDRGDQQGRRGADLQRGRLRPGGRPVRRRAGAGRNSL